MRLVGKGEPLSKRRNAADAPFPARPEGTLITLKEYECFVLTLCPLIRDILGSLSNTGDTHDKKDTDC